MGRGVGGLALPPAMLPEVLLGVFANEPLQHLRVRERGGLHIGVAIAGAHDIHRLEVRAIPTSAAAERRDEDHREVIAEREDRRARGVRAGRPKKGIIVLASPLAL